MNWQVLRKLGVLLLLLLLLLLCAKTGVDFVYTQF